MIQAELRMAPAGVPAWEMNRNEIALENRSEGANLRGDFGVPAWEKPL